MSGKSEREVSVFVWMFIVMRVVSRFWLLIFDEDVRVFVVFFVVRLVWNCLSNCWFL